jgi:predicted pyridoxine 5'-phosphate oxidase superfamily flavin-nucleotide-binding protein
MDGHSPETTRPVLMTRDPVILEAFAKTLERRVRSGAATSDAAAIATSAQDGTARSEARRFLRLLRDEDESGDAGG